MTRRQRPRHFAVDDGPRRAAASSSEHPRVCSDVASAKRPHHQNDQQARTQHIDVRRRHQRRRIAQKRNHRHCSAQRSAKETRSRQRRSQSRRRQGSCSRTQSHVALVLADGTRNADADHGPNQKETAGPDAALHETAQRQGRSELR